jgi:hypothetical protein
LAAATNGNINLLEVVAKVASGQMGVDDVCKIAGLSRVTRTGGDIAIALDRLVDNALAPNMDVHEVTGTIGGVPVHCIVVGHGKIKLTKG